MVSAGKSFGLRQTIPSFCFLINIREFATFSTILLAGCISPVKYTTGLMCGAPFPEDWGRGFSGKRDILLHPRGFLRSCEVTHEPRSAIPPPAHANKLSHHVKIRLRFFPESCKHSLNITQISTPKQRNPNPYARGENVIYYIDVPFQSFAIIHFLAVVSESR